MRRSAMILIAALILAALVWLIERPGKDDGGNFSPFILLPAFEGTDVEAIEVKHLINGARLEKGDGGWQVLGLETEIGQQMKGEADADAQEVEVQTEVQKAEDKAEVEKRFRADAEKVSQVLEHLKRTEVKSLVSNNPEKQNIYQVGPLAKTVILYGPAGKVLATLYFGKNGPDMFSTYVRREGENEVYLVGEQIGAMIPPDVMGWRDKKIWDVVPADLESVTVTKGKDSFTIARAGEEGWTLTSPNIVMLDTNKVSHFFEQIFPLKATRFAHVIDRAETGLDRPGMTISFTTDTGDKKTIRIGEKDKQGYIYAELDGETGENYLMESSFPTKIPSNWADLMPNIEKSE